MKIDRVQNARRIGFVDRRHTDGLPKLAHETRGVQPAARYVADADQNRSVLQRNGVVPIAADVGLAFAGAIVRRKLEPGRLRQHSGLWKKRLLQRFGNSALAFERALMLDRG